MVRVMIANVAALLIVAWPTTLVSAASDDKLLDEVRTAFTIEGKPIPPEIFRDFGDGDLADSGPIWVTLDVRAAVGSNLYADPIKVDRSWVIQTKQAGSTLNGQEETSYKRIGVTSNKLLVLIATYNSGGSGTFVTLHILDVGAQTAFDSDGQKYGRINVTAVRSIALGDRWEGDATISGDTIIVRTMRAGPADDRGATQTLSFEAVRP